MTRKIQYMEAHLNASKCVGFLYYPSDPFDLAIVWNKKKAVVKPIIQHITDGGYFKNLGCTLFLRNFREENYGTIIPDWAIEWVQARIDGKLYKIDMRLSRIDLLILNSAVHRRKSELQQRLMSLE